MAREALSQWLDNAASTFLPAVSIDCVIFGFHENQLRVLLHHYEGGEAWGLPGGFIRKEQSLEAAASAILEERTGLQDIFLQQFQTFGAPDRSDAEFHRKNMDEFGYAYAPHHWIFQRFITVGYYALVEYEKARPGKDEFSAGIAWWDVSSLPRLMMDHKVIIEAAWQALRLHLRHHPVGLSLLPAKFTMPQLQKLYETILGRKLDRRNFQRKMLAYDILVNTGVRKEGGAHKAPYLYRFDLRKYKKALREGLETGW